MSHTIKVTLDSMDVGVISYADDVYSFSYTKEWQIKGFAISPNIPFNKEIDSSSIKTFLQNLIPEGKGLEDIVAFRHISKNNVFAIIKMIGYDTSGALMFGDEFVNSDKAIFREIATDELSKRVKEIEEVSIAIWDKKERLSLAGVQEKLPIIIKDSKIGLGDGLLASTHIMKFQTKKHNHIVINELFCMSLAKRIGLNVADVELKRIGSQLMLLVKRFDRVYTQDRVTRIHVIDGCQMLNLAPSYKYERNYGSSRDVKDIRDGASFSKLFGSANLCEVPAKAKLEMLQWAIFNLIIGNSDAHAKNFSFFVDKQGVRPTPFYDMLCILMYDGIEHDLAMAYGDEFNSSEIKAYQLREFAEDIDINYKLVSKTLQKQCSIIQQVIDEILSTTQLFKDEKVFIQQLKELIIQRVKCFSEVALNMGKVTY